MHYRDRTFCAHESCAKFSDCSKALTDEVREAAVKWWGNENAPISVDGGKKDCYEEFKCKSN